MATMLVLPPLHDTGDDDGDGDGDATGDADRRMTVAKRPRQSPPRHPRQTRKK